MIKRFLELVPLKVFLVGCVFLVSSFVFVFIADEAVLEKKDIFDSTVRTYLTSHSTAELIVIMRRFTLLGSSYFLLPAYILLLAYLVIRKKFRQAIDIFIISSSCFLVMQALKHLFHRKRPDLPLVKGLTSYSFPSGHALSSFIFCSMIAYLVWSGKLPVAWKLAIIILLVLIAMMIGISRVVLNVHYATDVIAGFCLAVMWVTLSFWILRKFNY